MKAPSRPVRQLLPPVEKRLPTCRCIPIPDWTELRKAIADVHGVDPQSVLCGAGSMELIGCLIRAYADAGDAVLGTELSYAYVASAVAQVRAEFVRAREVDFTVCVNEILSAVSNRTRIVFVCNPGNPSGTAIKNSEIVRLRSDLPDNILLAIDQAYGEFADDDPDAVFPLVERGDTVVLRTFSKAHGLAAEHGAKTNAEPGMQRSRSNTARHHCSSISATVRRIPSARSTSCSNPVAASRAGSPTIHMDSPARYGRAPR